MIDPNNINRILVAHAQPSEAGKFGDGGFSALGKMQIDLLKNRRFPHCTERLGGVASCVVASDTLSYMTAEELGVSSNVVAESELLDLPSVDSVWRRKARFNEALTAQALEIIKSAPAEDLWIASPLMVDAILRHMGQLQRDVAYGQAHVISFAPQQNVE